MRSPPVRRSGNGFWTTSRRRSRGISIVPVRTRAERTGRRAAPPARRRAGPRPSIAVGWSAHDGDAAALREAGSRVMRRAEAVGKAAKNDGDVAGAVRGLVREATHSVPDAVRAAGKRADTESVQRLQRAVDAAVGDHPGRTAKGQRRAAAGATADESAALLKLRDADGTSGTDRARASADGSLVRSAAPTRLCSSGGGSDCASGSVRSGARSDAEQRGPPKSRRDSGQRESYDDSADRTDRVLEGEIKVDKSEKALAAEKKKVSSGTVSKKKYAADEAKHEKLVTQVETDRAELSPERAALVDEVIEGNRGLATTEKTLAAEAKKVKSGSVTAAAHDKKVAVFEETRDEVYAATDELREVTGHDDVDEPGAGGTGASCASSGAFFGCGATAGGSDSSDGSDGLDGSDGSRSGGRSESGRCVGLAGVSSGCSASAGSGSDKATGSCTMSGSEQGCKTSSTTGKQQASASCTTGSQGCRSSSSTSVDRAAAGCEGGDGCRSSSTAAAPADGARGLGQSTGSGSCTKSCGLDTRASAQKASADCRTGNGTCDTSSTGSRKGTSTAEQVSFTGSASTRTSESGTAKGTARCAATAGGCSTSTGTDLGGNSEDDGSDRQARADVECDQGATGCSGTTSSSTGGSTTATTTTTTTTTAADLATGTVASTKAGAPTAHRTTGSATCSVTAGGCETSSGSGDDTGGDTDGDGADSAGTATAQTRVDCDDAAGCSGKGATATNATVVHGSGTTAATRKTSGSTSCAATAGGCSADSTSTATAHTDTADTADTDDEARGRFAAATTGAPAAETVTLAASSEARSSVDCDSADCTGTARSATSGAASGDVKGVRDSTGTASCAARGVGGDCGADSDSSVEDREADPAQLAAGIQQVSGPVSVSHAGARVDCASVDGSCGGTAASSTSALDSGVSPYRRGSSSTAECTVSGGGCSGESSSAGSSAPDFVRIDPRTGRPAAGQPTTGPSSTSLGERVGAVLGRHRLLGHRRHQLGRVGRGRGRREAAHVGRVGRRARRARVAARPRPARCR